MGGIRRRQNSWYGERQAPAVRAPSATPQAAPSSARGSWTWSCVWMRWTGTVAQPRPCSKRLHAVRVAFALRVAQAHHLTTPSLRASNELLLRAQLPSASRRPQTTLRPATGAGKANVLRTEAL